MIGIFTQILINYNYSTIVLSETMNHFIKLLGSPVLREPCATINIIGQDTKKAADKLRFALMKSQGWAVAANQVGISKAMFVFSYEKQRNKILINPQIKEASTELWTFEESCLSIPGFSFPIQRPRTVLVEALNLNGDTIELEGSDLLGRILQHEIQHLSGGLVIDLLDPDTLLDFEKRWKKR